jgi:hypothetical protein
LTFGTATIGTTTWFSVSDANDPLEDDRTGPPLTGARGTAVCSGDDPARSEVTGDEAVVPETDDMDVGEIALFFIAAMRASRGSVRSQLVGTFQAFFRGVTPVGTSSCISSDKKTAVRSIIASSDVEVVEYDSTNDFDVLSCCLSVEPSRQRVAAHRGQKSGGQRGNVIAHCLCAGNRRVVGSVDIIREFREQTSLRSALFLGLIRY